MMPFAFETLTVPSADGTVVLTKTKYFPASGGLQVQRALVTINPGAPISFVLVNTVTVTSALGHRLTPFSSLSLDGPQEIAGFIATSMSSGTTGEISVTYYR